MKNVRIIPAIPKENNKLKVAAYCQVSTSRPEQLRSLEIQIKTYTKMIKNHPNWLYAGVFYDIESGASAKRQNRAGKNAQGSGEVQNRLHYHQVNQQGVKRHSGGFENYKIFKRERDQYAF